MRGASQILANRFVFSRVTFSYSRLPISVIYLLFLKGFLMPNAVSTTQLKQIEIPLNALHKFAGG